MEHPTPATLLEAVGLTARYGRVTALDDVSVTVRPGEFVTVLGPNGAGKTTLMRAIMRLVPRDGRVRFRGDDLTGLQTHQLAQRGMIMVQEGRGLFAQMSVRDNLGLGGFTQPGGEAKLDEVLAIFPRLRERFGQTASSLSGGEQQMLAIGRALMASPKLLMLDEPSLGLAPRAASAIMESLAALNQAGLGILLVEQKAPLALKLAKRVYVLSLGRVAAELAADQIGSHHDLARYYFG